MLVERLLTFSAIHAAIRDGYVSMLNLSGPSYTILLCIRNLSDLGSVNVDVQVDPNTLFSFRRDSFRHREKSSGGR